MRIDAREDRGSLVIAAHYSNTMSEPLYLLNWLVDWYEILATPDTPARRGIMNAPPTRAIAYCCLGSGGEAVLLSGTGPDVPPDAPFRPYMRRLPYATRLLPGESFTQEIRMPLPLVEWHAYSGRSKGPTDPVPISTIRYRLETLRPSAALIPIRELANFPGCWVALGKDTTVIEATAQLPHPITLLRRTDAFERFG